MSANSDFDDLLAIAKEFLQAVTKELDPYTKEKGVVEVEKARVILLTPSHIQFARYGRGPGKKPPFDNILKWVQEEGIKFENSTERGTAFAIQANIGLNGTKNWVPNAPNALEVAIKNHLQEYSESLGKKLLVRINDDVSQIYKQFNFKDIS